MTNVGKKIITLDFEASGMSKKSYPIEVGLSLADGRTWCTLIKPITDWEHWDADAEEVHGISREDLTLNGKAPLFVAEQLNQLLADKTVYSDCIAVDESWLITLYEAAGINPRFKLIDIVYIMDEERYGRLLTTKKEIAKDLQLTRHRASNDALILQMAYEQLY